MGATEPLYQSHFSKKLNLSTSLPLYLSAGTSLPLYLSTGTSLPPYLSTYFGAHSQELSTSIHVEYVTLTETEHRLSDIPMSLQETEPCPWHSQTKLCNHRRPSRARGTRNSSRRGT